MLLMYIIFKKKIVLKMENEKKNLKNNHEQLAKAFKHKSMIFNNNKNKLMNEYNKIFKSYKVKFIFKILI